MVVDDERTGGGIPHLQRAGTRAGGSHHSREAERRVDAAVVLHHQRDAAEDAVGVRHGIQKTRPGRRSFELRQIADGAGRPEERNVLALARALRDDERQRMREARARLARISLEGHGVAEHDAPAPIASASAVSEPRGRHPVPVAAHILRFDPIARTGRVPP